MAHVKSIIRGSWRELNQLYARRGRYSRVLDRINRLPLLRDYASPFGRVPAFPTREAMWSHLASLRTGAIDYLEFGVHAGHSILHWAQANRDAQSHFVGFDTFEGLPEEWNTGYPKGYFDRGGKEPPTEDRRVRFVKGLFQETLDGFLASFSGGRSLVVHVDCDLYSSTLYCLTKLDPLLKVGTMVIFDEFGDVQHEFRAFCDYLASYRREARLICTHDRCFTAAVEMR